MRIQMSIQRGLASLSATEHFTHMVSQKLAGNANRIQDDDERRNIRVGVLVGELLQLRTSQSFQMLTAFNIRVTEQISQWLRPRDLSAIRDYQYRLS